MKKLILLCALLLQACATGPVPMTNQIEAASLTARDLAIQIDRLQKTHIISNEREDKLMAQLLEANNALRLASTLAASCGADCSNAEAQLKAAKALLAQLQTTVSDAEKPQ